MQDILRKHEWIIKVCNFLIFKVLLRFKLGRLRIHELIYKTNIAIYRHRLNKFYAPFTVETRSATSLTNNNNIFIFWLQGYDNAPAVVKKCIDCARRNSNGFTVHLITEENLEKYTKEMPPGVLESINRFKGNSVEFFSYVLRMWLLSHYGGLWCDPTMYHTSKIELPYTDRYYSIRRTNGSKLCIANGRWASYYQYSPAGNIVTQFLFEALCYYAGNADFIMDSMLFDEIMDYAYNNVDAIRQEIDRIPMSNHNVLALKFKLNTPWNESFYNRLAESTSVFKLSRKIKINREDKNNFFAHLQ